VNINLTWNPCGQRFFFTILDEIWLAKSRLRDSQNNLPHTISQRLRRTPAPGPRVQPGPTPGRAPWRQSRRSGYSVVATSAINILALQQIKKLLLAQPHIAHYLDQHSPPELFSGMYGDDRAPAIGMLHDEVATSLPHRLKADLGKSLDHNLGFNWSQLQLLALPQNC